MKTLEWAWQHLKKARAKADTEKTEQAKKCAKRWNDDERMIERK